MTPLKQNYTNKLTKVEVSTLLSGLEESAPSLSMNISPFLHQKLHILFTSSFYGDMQCRLTYGHTTFLL